jgi:hypothetical protein
MLHFTYLSAVDSASFSSSVRLSPEERKLSAREHGRGERVLLASSVWSQLRGTWSLQNVARSVALADSVAVTSGAIPLLPPLMTTGYRVILSFPLTGSLLHTARGEKGRHLCN